MSEASTIKLPMWFWVIAILALLWNLMGVASYLSFAMMGEEALAELPAAEKALIDNYPAWATGAFAIAVFAGIAGAILLLMRMRIAVPTFGVSLVAILLQMTWWVGLSGAAAVYGGTFIIMPLCVIGAAAFLLWFSMQSKGKGWLR